MNSEQVNALNRVLAHYGPDDMKHFREGGEPSGHIARELMVLSDYMNHRQPTPNGEHVGEHPLDQAGSPIGIVRDHPSQHEPENSQGPSVADIHREEIETRWAKETIAMVAVELNEAYAQFVITSDGCEKPTGKLCGAFRQLEEAMQRLGINTETDPIPF